MKTAFVSLAAAAALLAAGCGASDDDAGGGEDGSAVTVAGEDSAIVAEGDDRPDDEGDAAAVVKVKVDVPEGADLAGIAVVALEDITVADTESVEIARVELAADQLSQQENIVEVFLPLPLDGSVDVTATVHIDVDENGSFSQGDWISPDLVPVTAEQSSVIVQVVRI